jgi:hypothetical protein
LAVPKRVQGQVVGDGEKPGGELGFGGVLFSGSVDAKEGFLGEVLCLIGVPHEMVHNGDEPVLEPFDQFGERRIVIVADPEHQPYVRVAQGHLRAGLTDGHAMAPELPDVGVGETKS